MSTSGTSDTLQVVSERMRREIEEVSDKLRLHPNKETLRTVVDQIVLIVEAECRGAIEEAVKKTKEEYRQKGSCDERVVRWIYISFIIAPVVLFWVFCVRLAIFCVQLKNENLTGSVPILLAVVALILVLVAICGYMFSMKSIGEKSRALKALRVLRDLVESIRRIMD